MQDVTCSFTGHRQIFHAHTSLLPDALDTIIARLFNSGYRWFQSGGALGFDLLAAASVLRLRGLIPEIKLRMLLPCRDQTRRWRECDAAHWRKIIECADDVVYLHDMYTPYCMHERNKKLVDTASILVSYLTRETGGTAYTVRYGASRGIKIINIADLL